MGLRLRQRARRHIYKDDDGKTVGAVDYKKLVDDLPNKIRDVLGIMAEVNLHADGGLYFIEIVMPPYSVPISLRGNYYCRSGSTKQELKGNALMEFLLRKSGKTWDDVVEPRLRILTKKLSSVSSRMPRKPGDSRRTTAICRSVSFSTSCASWKTDN